MSVYRLIKITLNSLTPWWSGWDTFRSTSTSRSRSTSGSTSRSRYRSRSTSTSIYTLQNLEMIVVVIYWQYMYRGRDAKHNICTITVQTHTHTHIYIYIYNIYIVHYWGKASFQRFVSVSCVLTTILIEQQIIIYTYICIFKYSNHRLQLTRCLRNDC